MDILTFIFGSTTILLLFFQIRRWINSRRRVWTNLKYVPIFNVYKNIKISGRLYEQYCEETNESRYIISLVDGRLIEVSKLLAGQLFDEARQQEALFDKARQQEA